MSLNSGFQVIGQVPFWDTYYNQTPGQSYWTDGTWLYNDIGEQLAPIGGASATAASSDASASDFIAQAAATIPALITGWNAYQLSQINVKRAAQGLPALNTAAYGATVGVSLSPQTQQMLLFGGIGLAVVILMSGRRR